jgi:UDP-glucose 4-epimerase
MLAPNQKYEHRTVLITGGLGFIGSNLAHRLVEMGDVEVIIIDSLDPDQGGNLFNVWEIKDKLQVHIGDMNDGSVINHLVAGVDYIFNLAGSSSHIDSMQNPHRDLESNCQAQLTLLEACRMFNPQVKIVFTSTRQVYGSPLYLPLDENHRVSPIDVNGVHKLAAEYYHLLYQRVYGLQTTCLRLTNTYGPRQQIQNDRHGFISWFIRKAMNGETIELFGDGKQRRDLNYVGDVVDALLISGASEEANGEIYNIGHHRAVSLYDLATQIVEIAGSGSLLGVPFPRERRQIDIGNCYSSYEKIQNKLGWQPRTDLRTGLMETIEFYKKYRDEYWGVKKSSAVP